MFLARKISVLCVLFCLFTALFLIGCDTGNGGSDVIVGLDTRLIGTWESSFNETYEITSTHLKFTGFGGTSWGGSIEYATRFNNNTGVIIIRYDADKKQQWAIYDANFNITGYHDAAGRDFYAIYFRNLTQNSVILSNTSDTANNWGPSETASLAEAISVFTFDNMANWVDLSFATPFDRVP